MSSLRGTCGERFHGGDGSPDRRHLVHLDVEPAARPAADVAAAAVVRVLGPAVVPRAPLLLSVALPAPAPAAPSGCPPAPALFSSIPDLSLLEGQNFVPTRDENFVPTRHNFVPKGQNFVPTRDKICPLGTKLSLRDKILSLLGTKFVPTRDRILSLLGTKFCPYGGNISVAPL